MFPRSFVSAFALAALMVTMSGACGAEDAKTNGVVLIDQSRALADNVTPGDNPGFPVTITQPGTYQLTSDLMVDQGDVILIAADNVTIDLGGFTISSKTNRSGAITTSGANHSNLTIRNGIIAGFGYGVSLQGSLWVTVTQLRVYKSYYGAIVLGDNASITDSSSYDNRVDGIRVGSYSLIARNVVSGNGADGINAGSGSLISGNAVYGNAGNGIVCLDLGCVISANTVRSNSHSGIYTAGSNVNANTTTENHDSGIYCNFQCLIGFNVATTSQNGDGIRVDCPSVIRGNLASSIAGVSAACVMSDNIPSP